MKYLNYICLFIALHSISSAQAGYYPSIHDAVRESPYDPSYVQELLREGHSVDEYDKDGNTALFNAARDGHSEMVEFLVKHADVNLKNRKMRTPLYIAVKKGYLSIVRTLLAAQANTGFSYRYKGMTVLHFSVKAATLKTAELLLENGANVDAVSIGGTPLAYAAFQRNPWAIRLLMDHGADPNLSSEYSSTPLMKLVSEVRPIDRGDSGRYRIQSLKELLKPEFLYRFEDRTLEEAENLASQKKDNVALELIQVARANLQFWKTEHGKMRDDLIETTAWQLKCIFSSLKASAGGQLMNHQSYVPLKKMFEGAADIVVENVAEHIIAEITDKAIPNPAKLIVAPIAAAYEGHVNHKISQQNLSCSYPLRGSKWQHFLVFSRRVFDAIGDARITKISPEKRASIPSLVGEKYLSILKSKAKNNRNFTKEEFEEEVLRAIRSVEFRDQVDGGGGMWPKGFWAHVGEFLGDTGPGFDRLWLYPETYQDWLYIREDTWEGRQNSLH